MAACCCEGFVGTIYSAFAGPQSATIRAALSIATIAQTRASIHARKLSAGVQNPLRPSR